MSKTKRKSGGQPSSAPRAAPAESRAENPLALVLRTLVIGLIIVRWLIPAESAGAGETLWLVQLEIAAVILWAWSCLRGGNYAVRWTLLDCALWVLVATHWLSAAFVFLKGGDRRTALNLAWEWVGLGATFFLLRQTILTALDARRLACVVVALAVVLSGFGIWQHYVYYRLASIEYTKLINELDALEKNPNANPQRLGELQFTLQQQGIPTDEMGRRQYVNRLKFSSEALGPFALANTFAGFLLVMLVLAGELVRTLPSPRPKAMIAAWAGAFLLLFYCLILTKSRTAWTGLLVAGALWGTTVLLREPQWFTRRTLVWIGAGIVGVVALFAIAALGKGFDAQVIWEAPKSLSYRFQYWIGAARTVAASPIFGTGPGNFRQHYLRYKVPESSEEIADPHNWLLDLWASGGVLAVASFVACGALVLVQLIGRRGGNPLASPEKAVQLPPWTRDLPGPVLGFSLGLVAPVAAASGNFDGWQLLLLAIWGLTFAVLRRGIGSARLTLIALGAAALGLMIHLTGAGGIEMPATVQLLLVLTALAFATLERRDDATVAPRLVFVVGGLGVALFVALFFTGTLPVVNRRAALASGEQALFVDRHFDRAVGDFGIAAQNDPFSPEPHEKLADAFFARWQASPPGDTTDYFGKCVTSLKEAIRQDPMNPLRYRRLGEFYSARFARSQDAGDARAAAEALQQAVDIHPTEATLRSEYAVALFDAGKRDEAKTQASKALEQDELNHHWGHTDRYLPDPMVNRLRRLAAAPEPHAEPRSNAMGSVYVRRGPRRRSVLAAKRAINYHPPKPADGSASYLSDRPLPEHRARIESRIAACRRTF
jgi:tetratricopeptide (TPR) repeat protein